MLTKVPAVTSLAVRGFFHRLQESGLRPSRQHQAYRTPRTFFRWAVGADALAVCPRALEGVRNRTLIPVLADSGLRASDA